MMPKKDMTPIGKKGALHTHVNKASDARDLPGAGTGGAPSSFQDYGKATPMAQPQAPAPDGLGSGSWPGIATG